MALEPSTPSPWKERLRKFWHPDSSKHAIVRDVVVAGGVVLILLTAIWVYAGQPITTAPVVSVESGSMMHGPFSPGRAESPGFGRLGTIDPGDIVFVKRVRSASDVVTAFSLGKRSGYGGHGDVIVYRPYGSTQETRIIHRAMLYVEAVPEGCTPGAAADNPNRCTYRIPAFCNNPELEAWGGTSDLVKYCEGSSDAISLNLSRDGLSLRVENYPCPAADCGTFHSSFITKGDNNPGYDQARAGRDAISTPVRLEWIIGKARGEIPWFGLIKLAIYGNENYSPHSDPTHGPNWHILNARAPRDIWLCLFLSLGVLIALPMLIDAVNTRRAKNKESDGPAP